MFTLLGALAGASGLRADTHTAGAPSVITVSEVVAALASEPGIECRAAEALGGRHVLITGELRDDTARAIIAAALQAEWVEDDEGTRNLRREDDALAALEVVRRAQARNVQSWVEQSRASMQSALERLALSGDLDDAAISTLAGGNPNDFLRVLGGIPAHYWRASIEDLVAPLPVVVHADQLPGFIATRVDSDQHSPPTRVRVVDLRTGVTERKPAATLRVQQLPADAQAALEALHMAPSRALGLDQSPDRRLALQSRLRTARLALILRGARLEAWLTETFDPGALPESTSFRQWIVAEVAAPGWISPHNAWERMDLLPDVDVQGMIPAGPPLTLTEFISVWSATTKRTIVMQWFPRVERIWIQAPMDAWQALDEAARTWGFTATEVHGAIVLHHLDWAEREARFLPYHWLADLSERKKNGRFGLDGVAELLQLDYWDLFTAGEFNEPGFPPLGEEVEFVVAHRSAAQILVALTADERRQALADGLPFGRLRAPVPTILADLWRRWGGHPATLNATVFSLHFVRDYQPYGPSLLLVLRSPVESEPVAHLAVPLQDLRWLEAELRGQKRDN